MSEVEIVPNITMPTMAWCYGVIEELRKNYFLFNRDSRKKNIAKMRKGSIVLKKANPRFRVNNFNATKNSERWGPNKVVDEQ